MKLSSREASADAALVAAELVGSPLADAEPARVDAALAVGPAAVACKDGCPSCIGPDAGADAKVLTRRLLLNILEQTPSNEEV